MTIRYKYYYIILLSCLSVLPQVLRAQGYQLSDNLPYHASSVYFLTLENTNHENVNSIYSSTEGAIGAFVGDELRGSSQWFSTGAAAGQGFFLIRVWGAKDDPATVTFRLHDTSGQEQEIGTQPFAQEQEGTYGTPSAPITLTVQEPEVPEVTMAFAVQELTASKLRDTELTLTKFGTAVFFPSKVELVFSHAENGEPVGVATMADATGLKWTIRGKYVGQHTIKIKYNGIEQLSSCHLNIPAEYQIEPGWNWMSFYAVSASDAFYLKNGDNYVGIRTDENNFVADIRTQRGVLHYDPQIGYMGNLNILSASGGAFKVRGEYDENSTDRIILNLGYEFLIKGSSLPNPKVKQGYTWVNYPHEVTLSIDDLSPYLSKTATDGDMLIGRDGFAEFTGDEWITSSDFQLTPGSGYIYYTESTVSRNLDWGTALKPTLAASKRKAARAKQDPSPWEYNPARYPDCMPVVAQLDGIENPEDYSIAAFVGDECRGQGEAADNGLMYIAVSGQRGDRVSFRLLHKTTATIADIPDTEVAFTGHIGSSRAPLQLHPFQNDIQHLDTDTQSGVTETYDMLGRRLSSASTFQGQGKGLYIITVTKGDHRVTRKILCK